MKYTVLLAFLMISSVVANDEHFDVDSDPFYNPDPLSSEEVEIEDESIPSTGSLIVKPVAVSFFSKFYN